MSRLEVLSDIGCYFDDDGTRVPAGELVSKPASLPAQGTADEQIFRAAFEAPFENLLFRPDGARSDSSCVARISSMTEVSGSSTAKGKRCTY